VVVVTPKGEVYLDRLKKDASSSLEFGQNTLALAIGLGRASSHEIAHYLLQRNFDQPEVNNIMNSNSHGGDWFTPSSRHKWKFTADQIKKLNGLCGR
jgi:hypothetical protein